MARARLLVVDNEDMVRTVLTRMLRDCSYDVVEAANGRVALDELAATPRSHFDLVVTNSRLPGLPGVDFIAEVRNRYPEIGILHVTGHPDAVEDSRLEALGVRTLVKPFHQEELVAAVEEGLRESKKPVTARGESVM
jgi:DNA-binding response OmpR family regulator